MCGISAYYSFTESIDQDQFKRFTDTLSHRGMDGFGYYFTNDNRVALGHRRLSILDLSNNGSQPMHYLNGRYSITYNGEIFNYRELRSELESKGFRFSSNSDTEVLLASYVAFGADCVTRFNGMWAFVIYDHENRSFFASRDRFGIKPFYYYADKQRVIFASETTAFSAYKNLGLSLNRKGIAKELTRPVFLEGSNQTIFHEVNCLPAGHNMVLHADGTMKLTKWWDISKVKEQAPRTFTEQTEKFKSLFYDSIQLRLRSDVKVGTALSGGVDSSAVYCSLNEIARRSSMDKNPADYLKAYVASFPGTQNDETDYAKQIINGYSNDYQIVEPDYHNLAAQLEKNTLETGIITGTPLLPVYHLYKSMKHDGTTVSLDGHGADEQLYGYTWLVLAAQHGAAANNNKARSNSLSDCYLNLFPPSRRQGAMGHLKKTDTILKSFLKKLRSAKQAHAMDNWSLSEIRETNKNPEELLLENFSLTHLPSILRNFDRASMRAGVEIRMPFMDYRLVSYLHALPIETKIGNGYTKLILREAMKGIVPDNIRLRTYKLGINAPLYDWFNGPLKMWLRDTISSGKFTGSDLFAGAKIREDVERELHSGKLSAETCNRLWPYLSANIIT